MSTYLTMRFKTKPLKTMANKTTKQPDSKKETKAPAKAAKKKTAAPGNRTANGDVFKFKESPEGAKKLAPQAQGIVDTIKAAGDKGVTRKKLCEALTSVITTRQPIERILTYYQKPLLNEGWITVDKATAGEDSSGEGEDSGE